MSLVKHLTDSETNPLSHYENNLCQPQIKQLRLSHKQIIKTPSNL